MNKEINKTTKRLLMAMQNGVIVAFADGHRWIQFRDVLDNMSLGSKLRNKKIVADIKVYGNLIDALNYIDYLLDLIGEETLEKQFDKYNDFGFDDEFLEKDKSWEDSGYEKFLDFVHKTSIYE